MDDRPPVEKHLAEHSGDLLSGRQPTPRLAKQSSHSLEVIDITTSDNRLFIGHMLDTRSPATAQQRYRSLRVLFKWLLNEEEIAIDPMEKVAKPKVEEKPVPVISVCRGSGPSPNRQRDTPVSTGSPSDGVGAPEDAGVTAGQPIPPRVPSGRETVIASTRASTVMTAVDPPETVFDPAPSASAETVQVEPHEIVSGGSYRSAKGPRG